MRYLGEVLRALERSLPDAGKTDAVNDVLAYLRELVRHTDASLLQEWEARASGKPASEARSEPTREPSGVDRWRSWASCKATTRRVRR